MTSFGELQIGDEFDFIGPDRMLNSFFHRCMKISARKYRWFQSGQWLESRVGTLSADVYHITRRIP